jgi:hypothetical protein
VKGVPCLNEKAPQAVLEEELEHLGLLWEYTGMKREGINTVRTGYPDGKVGSKASANKIPKVNNSFI